MALPAKTSIRIDALLESTLRHLKAAKQNSYPTSVVDTALTCLIEGLACTLLNLQQQGQIQAVLALWKECSAISAEGENEGPDVVMTHRAK